MPVTAPTPKNIMLGEGVFYINYDNAATPPAGSNILVGAVNKGKFSRKPKYTDIEFMGRRGAVKGLKRKVEWEVTISFEAVELVQTANIQKFFAGLQNTVSTTQDVITAKKNISDADYLTNVAFVGETQTGDAVVIIVKNALGDGSLELAFEDRKEVVPEVTYTGHALLADVAAEPWEMRWLKQT